VAPATARRHPLQWTLLDPSNFSIAKRSAGVPATITDSSTAPSSRPSHDDILTDNTRPQCFSVSHVTQAPMATGHRLANHDHLHQRPRLSATLRRERPHWSPLQRTSPLTERLH
jgi:hypothetical protein